MLSGDSNISGAANNVTCGVLSAIWTSLGIGGGPPQAAQITVTSTWTSSVHNNGGDIGLGDGSVQQMTSNALQKQAAASDDNANNHARVPND